MDAAASPINPNLISNPTVIPSKSIIHKKFTYKNIPIPPPFFPRDKGRHPCFDKKNRIWA